MGFVFGVPVVCLKPEGLWSGAGSDVDVRLHLSTAEGDAIVFDHHVATGREAGFTRFLEDAEKPFGGKSNGVSGELCPIHSNEGCGAETAFNLIVAHDDSGGFVFDTLGSKERQTGGAADVERSLARIHELTFFDSDPTASTFHLDPRAGGETLFADESTARDEGVVTSDEVDALPSPTGDDAIPNGELL